MTLKSQGRRPALVDGRLSGATCPANSRGQLSRARRRWADDVGSCAGRTRAWRDYSWCRWERKLWLNPFLTWGLQHVAGPRQGHVNTRVRESRQASGGHRGTACSCDHYFNGLATQTGCWRSGQAESLRERRGRFVHSRVPPDRARHAPPRRPLPPRPRLTLSPHGQSILTGLARQG